MSLLFAQEMSENRTSMMFIASNANSNSLNYFWNFLDEHLIEDKKREILLMESTVLITALQFSACNQDPNSFLFIKEIYNKSFTRGEIREILMKTHESNLPFIFRVIQYASIETAFEVSKYLENLFQNKKIELRIFLRHRNKDGHTIFNWFKEQNEFEEKLKVFIELLRKTFNENEGEKYKQCFEKLMRRLNVFGRDNEHFDNENFHNLFWTSEDFEYFLSNESDKDFSDKNLRKILLSKNDNNWTVLHKITFGYRDENIIQPFLEKIQKKLKKTEISSLIFVQNSINNKTLLMNAAEDRKSKELEMFWNFLDKNLNEDEKRKILLVEQEFSWTALQFSTCNEDPKSFLFMKKIYEKFCTQDEIREIFIKTRKELAICLIQYAYGETVFEVSKYLENLFENKKGELRKILSFRNSLGKTIFGMVRSGQNFEKELKIWIKILRKTFEENQQEEFEESLKNLEKN
jgi:hypothetical protein